MAQLLDYLISIFDGLIGWISVIIGFFGSIIGGMLRSVEFAVSMFGVTANLPGYFSWLPGAVLGLILNIFGFVIGVKILRLIK